MGVEIETISPGDGTGRRSRGRGRVPAGGGLIERWVDGAGTGGGEGLGWGPQMGPQEGSWEVPEPVLAVLCNRLARGSAGGGGRRGSAAATRRPQARRRGWNTRYPLPLMSQGRCQPRVSCPAG